LYRHPRRGRVALNIGGIANLTVIPAGARPQDVLAFDTGPGNMVIDAVVERQARGRQRFDRNGALAAQGQAIEPLLRHLLAHPYFRRQPPKSTGREDFGLAYAEQFLRRAGRASGRDKVRTATELTVRSIAEAFKRFILPRARIEEVILGGGGARNAFLLQRLKQSLPGLRFIPAGRLGVDEKAKE
ncbi:anhydro-N-acetylmuramic acid kinase, partial [Acidobacteriia bacterium AH_259_A11_L15]|nr:anhydro-N-acetylmuramic acid kinase [Acidobacteriia bacterium AH_259_A11_L15]